MKKRFSVSIAGRRYWLKIDQSDEEVMRKGAKALNQKINELSLKKFECNSYDLLAMAAISIAVECEEIKMRQKYSPDMQELNDLAATVRKALED